MTTARITRSQRKPDKHPKLPRKLTFSSISYSSLLSAYSFSSCLRSSVTCFFVLWGKHTGPQLQAPPPHAQNRVQAT